MLSVDLWIFFLFIFKKKCRTSKNVAGPVDPRWYWSYGASYSLS